MESQVKDELIEILREIVKEKELEINIINDEADWYNNNMPGVGQRLDYKHRAYVPNWLSKARIILKKATE